MSDVLSDRSTQFKQTKDKTGWLIKNPDLFQSAKAIRKVLNIYDIKPTYFRINKKHLEKAFVKTDPDGPHQWDKETLFGFDTLAKFVLSEITDKKYKITVDNYWKNKTNHKYSMFMKWHSFLTDMPKEYITPFSFRTLDIYPFVRWHPGLARKSFLQYLPEDTVIKLMTFDRENEIDDMYTNRLKDVLAKEIDTSYSYHTLRDKTENEIYKIMEMGTKWNTQKGAETLISHVPAHNIIEISQPFITVAPTQNYQIDINAREIWVNDMLVAYKIEGIWRLNIGKT